jgi:choline dehydrogenase-like flavoprotein
LGGSSAINGLAFAPPSPAGIDAWGKLGNPNWNWETLRPYLQRSYTLTQPESLVSSIYPAAGDKHGIPLTQAWTEAFKSEGYEPTNDFLAEERTTGTRDYTATVDPVSGFRSSPDSTYGVIASKRRNVSIITETTVQRIIFASGAGKTRATGVEVLHGVQVITIQAKKEVILAAGAPDTESTRVVRHWQQRSTGSSPDSIGH